MATPVGVNVVTSIARRFIMPTIVDTVFSSNPLFYRWNAGNKRIVTGGTQIELPFMYSRFGNGGPYQGYEVLDVAPNDTVKSGAWDWKQQYVPVTVDGLTLIKTDSPESIANIIEQQFAQAELEMRENLAVGIWSDGTGAKQIDGLEAAVDDGGVATTYAGLTRASNTWLNATDDSTTATLTLAALQSMHGSVGEGGRQATIIVSRQEPYNRYWNLLQEFQRFPTQPGGHDQQLAAAGFSNLLFNGTPWVVDSHVFDGPDSSNSAIVFLNEDYINWVVSPRADFYLEDFQKPVNQDAMTAKLLWAGNLVCQNPGRQGKLTAIAA
ncbi:MAG: phage major capsid protein [Acidimicrobiia bacterium]